MKPDQKINTGREIMSNQTRRTCVRMSEKEYQTLKQKSEAAGLSANAWLMILILHKTDYKNKA